MMRFLFKQPQAKRFDFKPRFYNETRERLHARVEAINRELDQEKGDISEAALRSKLKHTWRRQDSKKASQKSNRNVFVIACLLLIIAYLILR